MQAGFQLTVGRLELVTVLLKFMTTRLLFEFKRSNRMREFKPSQVLSHINRG